MALVINDRVKETTTTTGTGAVSLAGAVTGFETFAAGIGNSNTVYYCIAHQDQAEFEVGLGTLDGDSSDLTRTTIISSSNSDSAVNFSSGTKDVFCTLPASKLIFEDANNDVTVGRNLTVTGDLTVSGDDITMATNTSGAALIGDGTNFNPVAISGDITIAANGTAAIGSGVIVNADINNSAAIAMSKTAFTAGTGVSLSTNTLSVDAAQTGITSLLATDIKIGEDDQTKIDFETADEIHFYAANAEQVFVSDGVLGPQTDSDVDLGTNSVRFKDAYVDSVTVTGDISVGDDLTVEGGVIDVKNTGAQSVVRFYCESSNAHYAQIQAPAHSDFSGNVTLTLPATTDTLAGLAATQTFTNKTLTTPTITTPVINAGAQLKNGSTSAGFLEFFEDSDNGTNKATLIGPASTADVTITLPAATDTLVGKATTDTLTNKSLTAPILTGSASAAGSILFKEDTDNGTNAVTLIGPASTADVTVTLPAATDTLVGKATTDTLTNKTINGPDNTLTNIANGSLANSSITLNGTAVSLGGSATISAGTDWQAVKTSSFTAAAGEGYFINTSSSAITMTLPSSASIGDEVSFKDYANSFDTYALTVGRNSHKIEGAAADLTISVEGAGNSLVYVDSTKGWLLRNK